MADAPPPADQSTPEDQQKRSVHPVEVFIEQLIIALGLYAGSIGPMYWIWFDAKYGHGPWLVAAFYEPLWRLAEIPWIGNAINTYVTWWIY